MKYKLKPIDSLFKENHVDAPCRQAKGPSSYHPAQYSSRHFPHKNSSHRKEEICHKKVCAICKNQDASGKSIHKEFYLYV